MESALWGAVMIFCGVVGATIVGVIIDYTKLFKEVAVVSLSLAVICFIWFFEVDISVDGLGIFIFHAVISGFLFEGSGCQYCLLCLSLWVFCLSPYPGLHGIRSGSHLPCL